MLRWLRVGSVWAIDFAEPPLPVNGCYGRLLAVRDLASGQQLHWLPVGGESAATVIAALEMLFREHSPPLVLKSDNGSGFIANVTQELLARWQVWHLRSPPEWPEYNGSCEACIGSMKARTHHQSVQRGCAGEWTCDDVEAARRQANETARPWGMHQPSPEQSWRNRKPLAAKERAAFAKAVHEAIAASASQPAPLPAAAVQRAAISQSLVKRGLLEYRRGSRNRQVREPGQ